MALVEMKRRKREEYEMQLFGFHSRAVNATFKSLIQEKIQSKCQKLCESLAKKYKPEGDNIEILQTNEKKLMSAYYLGCRSHFPAIENCMEKLISIPQYVLMIEDKIQVNQYPDERFGRMRRELESLQHRLKKAIIFNAILKEEIEVIERFNEKINKGRIACGIIDDGSKYPDVNNMIIKLMRSYTGLQSYFDKSNDPHVVKNKKRCLTYAQKTHDENFL